MFEWILPHQIILLWATISVITGAFISLFITEGKHPMYMLANIFLCGFTGVVFGGIFVALTDALVWEAWSLLIPVFIGGLASYFMAMYLKDNIPKASIKVKPIAMIMAVGLILIMSFGSLITAFPNTTTLVANGTTSHMVYNAGDVNILAYPDNNGAMMLATPVTTININPANIIRPDNTESNLLKINTYHTSIEFPSKIAEDAHEGDYVSFKLDFSVPSNSPANWREPVWTVVVWAEADGQMGLSAGDYVLDARYMKIPDGYPTSGGEIYTSAPCLYDDNGEPMYAIYGANVGGQYMLFPMVFGLFDVWKDDSQYTFSNTPEGWTPPYDQSSWQLSAGSLSPKEDITSWVEISKGQSFSVVGKIYCPQGMANLSTTWYLTVVAYDYAYSTTSNVAYHSMSFTVKPMSAPIVNVTSSWWVEATAMGLLSLIAIAMVRNGKKLI